MGRVLHTAVGDEIQRIAQTDPDMAAELRTTDPEYAAEVRGEFDYDEDPADMDEEDYVPHHPIPCEECGSPLDCEGYCDNLRCPTND